MPSKKRKGLSSREYAAAQKAKTAPKAAARPTAKTTIPAGTRVASLESTLSAIPKSVRPTAQAAAPAYNAFAKTVTTAPQTSRENAAKAKSKSSKPKSGFPSVPSVLGINTAKADDGIDYNQAELTPQTKASGLGRALQIASDPFGIRKKIRGATGMADFGARPDFGISEALFGEGKDLRQDTGLADWTVPQGDKNTVLGVEESRYMNELGSIRDTDPTVDANQYVSQRKSGQSRTQPTSSSPYDMNPEDAPQTNDQFEKQMKDSGGTPWDSSTANIPSYEQQQNDLYSGGPGPEQVPTQAVGNRSGRGNGMYGNGAGVGNPAGEDPYIKELRKAYSSNGGEKWLRKQFDELIAALDPTYAQMQQEGTDELNRNLNQQNVQLASVMNANNVGDSEQRAQMMARQQGDTQTAIGALLAKLATAKAGDVSGYRSKMAESMGQLQDKNQTNKQKLMEAIQGYRDKQWDRDYKMKELGQKGSSTKANYKQVGVNSQLQPVYRDFNTGKQWIGEGLTPAMSATPQLQQDENGNWYYEQ